MFVRPSAKGQSCHKKIWGSKRGRRLGVVPVYRGALESSRQFAKIRGEIRNSRAYTSNPIGSDPWNLFMKNAYVRTTSAPQPSVDAIIYRIPSTRGTGEGKEDDERASRERERGGRDRGMTYILAYGSQGRAIDSVRS